MRGAEPGARAPMKDMQQISYANQAAAMAGRERFWLVDELEQLDPEDPVRVWVRGCASTPATS
ncbi:MAG: hypothetical protein H0U51_05165 [Propionibacteriales bacterium]|nr:hypothetical protein [Propionibacteriales bacterium]